MLNRQRPISADPGGAPRTSFRQDFRGRHRRTRPRRSLDAISRWWWRCPLRTRLGLLLICLCFGVLAGTGTVTFSTLSDALYRQLDERLSLNVNGVRTLAQEVGTPGYLSTSQRWTRLDDSTYVAIITTRGAPEGDGPRLPEPPPSEGTTVTVPSSRSGSDTRYRLRATLLPDGRTAVVALSMDSTERAVTNVILAVVTIELIGLVVLALLSTFVVRRALRPLEKAARAADVVAGGEFGHRLAEADAAPHTEVGRLAFALNGMLDQIQAAFAARDASEGRLRQFVADASHELRTPLQSIRGYGELYLNDALPDTAAVDQAMECMMAEVRRMARLVESLLMLARFDEEADSALEPVNLSQVVAEACRDAAAIAPHRPHTEHIALSLTILGDEAQLRGLITNLLANIRMHTPATTPYAVHLGSIGDEVVLLVTDEGPGIPAADLPRIFDRFYRAEKSRSRASGGSGLGLAIVAAIVELHGGRIHAESPAGGGTRIQVAFPAPVTA